MFQVTITGNTPAELAVNASVLAAALSSTSAVAVAALSTTEQARLRGDATIVPPKTTATAPKPPTAAEKKAAEKAAKKAAEEAAAAASTDADETEGTEADQSEAQEDESDPLDEAEETEQEEALTAADAKNLLLEVRAAYPDQATIVSQIVQEQGKVKKISEIDAKNIPAVVKKCRELLAKAPKKK